MLIYVCVSGRKKSQIDRCGIGVIGREIDQISRCTRRRMRSREINGGEIKIIGKVRATELLQDLDPVTQKILQQKR